MKKLILFLLGISALNCMQGQTQLEVESAGSGKADTTVIIGNYFEALLLDKVGAYIYSQPSAGFGVGAIVEGGHNGILVKTDNSNGNALKADNPKGNAILAASWDSSAIVAKSVLGNAISAYTEGTIATNAIKGVAGSGAYSGVYGQQDSDFGYGVYGITSSTTGNGIVGIMAGSGFSGNRAAGVRGEGAVGVRAIGPNALIATTTSPNGNAGKFEGNVLIDNKLRVDSTSLFLDDAQFQKDVFVTGTLTATTCNCPSDKRFKKNINPIDESLKLIDQLNPKSYEFNHSEHFDFPLGMHYGLIAQEVESILPGLVQKIEKCNALDEDGYKSVNYLELIPILIGGIQEQQDQIDQMKNENTNLRKMIEELKNEFDRISPNR